MDRPTLDSREAVVATVSTFATNGVAVGSIGGLVPVFGDRWDADSRALGLLLVVIGLSAIAGINVGGRLADAGGALRPVRLGSLICGLGLAALAVAPALPVALVMGVIYGFGNGLTDTSMNVLAVHVEEHRPRPVMSRFHACWSAGSFTGAGLVLLAGWLTDSATAVAVGVLLVAAAVTLSNLLTLRRYPVDTPTTQHEATGGGRGRIPAVAWILAVMAIGFGLAEGTAFDWSAVHVRDVAHLGRSQGAVGLAVFAVFMLVVRSMGDELVHRLGRRNVVKIGTTVAALGYVVGVVGSGLPVLLLGWALVGAGMALVAPQIYGLAGAIAAGRGLSLVVTFGYATMLVGPGVMGVLVHAAGVQRAMLLPLVAALVLSALAWVMPTEGSRETAQG